MEQQIADLILKIDALTTQVQYLTEQAQLAERGRRDRDELMHDLMPVANDAFRLTVEQLEEVQEYTNLNDLLRLLKRILRNGRNIEKIFDQLESVMDLIDTIGPMGDEAFGKAVDTLALMERKGYFAFAKGGIQIADNIVTSFSEDDVKKLGDNVVLILNVVKNMTQPEIMTFVNNTLMIASREVEKPVGTSLLSLLNQMRDPAVRRGLALTMRVLSVVGAQAADSKN